MRGLVLFPRRHLKLSVTHRQQSIVDYGGPASPIPSYTSPEVVSGLIGVRMAEHVAWGGHTLQRPMEAMDMVRTPTASA